MEEVPFFQSTLIFGGENQFDRDKRHFLGGKSCFLGKSPFWGEEKLFFEEKRGFLEGKSHFLREQLLRVKCILGGISSSSEGKFREEK